MKNIQKKTRIIIASLVIAAVVAIGGGIVTPQIDPPGAVSPRG